MRTRGRRFRERQTRSGTCLHDLAAERTLSAASVATPDSARPGASGPAAGPGAPAAPPPRASSEDDAPDAARRRARARRSGGQRALEAARLGEGREPVRPRAATASRFITRRFGFTGGLVFVGLLASVEGREIVGPNALLEHATPASPPGETVATPSGLPVTTDARVGGGVAAKNDGDFVGVHLLIEDLVTGAVYLDTKANKKPVAFIFQKKPLLTPVC